MSGQKFSDLPADLQVEFKAALERFSKRTPITAEILEAAARGDAEAKAAWEAHRAGYEEFRAVAQRVDAWYGTDRQ